MGSTYWVDHGGSATAPYDTQAKAATTLATIFAIPPAAGDIIYCCDNAGTGEVTANTLSLASSGDQTTGFIKVIGCNSSGTVDGTRYVIDNNASEDHIIDFAGYDNWWFENIEVKNNGGTAKDGFISSVATCGGHVFVNCCAQTCSGSGFNTTNFVYSVFWRCLAYTNIEYGFEALNGVKTFFCCSEDNTLSGYTSIHTAIGCISYNNDDDGMIPLSTGTLFNCVVDGNGDDGILCPSTAVVYSGAVIIGCRITNQNGEGTDSGINANSKTQIVGYCYLDDNGDADADNFINDTLMQVIPLEGGSTTSNLEAQSDTNDGYVAVGTNFATGYTGATDPHLRRTAITIPRKP